MKTVVILDMAHCGTTMLAGIVHRLGIPMMGENSLVDRVEDLDVRDALSSEATFRALCRERNGRSWGFKHPGAWRFAEWLRDYLEYPYYLAIYKDPVSVTWRASRQINGQCLLYTMRRMNDSISGIQASGLPVFWLSYHEAVTEPVLFVRRVAAILGLDADADTVAAAAAFIQPGGYPDERPTNA
jgi:hypothetical protein